MRIAVAAVLVLGVISARGQTASLPAGEVSGTIRSWGSEQMAELMTLWEQGFRRQHPAVRFEDRLKGTVSGMGGLYGGGADLSLMGREIWPTEAMAYEQMTGHPPTGVEVAIGSFDVPTKADALVVFVHRSNPIVALSLAELRSIFGWNDHASRAIHNWGDVGVTGALADKPIHLYGYKLDNAAAIFFKSVALKDSEWRSGIKTFANRTGSDGKRIDSGQLILDALKTDPYGIAISNPHYASAEVKAVSLVPSTGEGPIAPTKENVASGSYPLSRAVFIFFNHTANRQSDPVVGEFLRYVLSAEGQRDVVREGAYLPLPERIRQEQLRKLP